MINVKTIKDELGNRSGLTLTLDNKAVAELTNLLNRALNTYPEAPADWKGLSDMLVHGKILQLYSDG
jgi:hypothetical protein